MHTIWKNKAQRYTAHIRPPAGMVFSGLIYAEWAARYEMQAEFSPAGTRREYELRQASRAANADARKLFNRGAAVAMEAY